MKCPQYSLLLILAFIIGTTTLCIAEERPPEVFVEKGVCPGEYCRYGIDFTAVSDIDIFDKPNGKKTGTIKTGTKVQSITGDVYSFPLEVKRVPRRGTVFKDGKWIEAPGDDNYANENLDIGYGDRFFVIRYESEGYWKAWHNGNIISVPEIWDSKKEGEPKNVWWIQLKSENGMTFWVKAEPYQAFREAFKCIDPNCGKVRPKKKY